MIRYENPIDKVLMNFIILCLLIANFLCLISYYFDTTLSDYISTLLLQIFLNSIIIYLAFRLIVLRPICIQINDDGITLFYHFSLPLTITWNDIEGIVKTEGLKHLMADRINRCGKMKIKSQSWSFYMSYELATALMEAYKGPGQLKKVGNAWIIE